TQYLDLPTYITLKLASVSSNQPQPAPCRSHVAGPARRERRRLLASGEATRGQVERVRLRARLETTDQGGYRPASILVLLCSPILSRLGRCGSSDRNSPGQTQSPEQTCHSIFLPRHVILLPSL